ncbi:5'-methylthioadenosine/S-adenosylhomocysteine nucleosidase [Synoicihabitans lomoniglobus]|uniref:5'-methylthioadenosine/S-adenosylhomocysteine nucleosidase n=1 Tax=Synoicihabitans lomoniglobus TaxID=2909285 RepID=A0AAE9ZSC7_9BACT|nr:5'-methylthioadenosine/S-adenosylhomocysteine nucleosidase [Opitutaceae bacterium LMO-M01]WED64350.1 5'-methylthioadenosine/S-adenosylhomocysteine nucleosidase [Opitutaceae bacterium LMO-M01]
MIRRWYTCFLLLTSLAAFATAEPLYAVLGAYRPEMEALQAEFEVDADHGWTSEEIKGITFWRGTADGKDIILFRTGVSIVNAAYRLQLALDRFPITHVLFSGVAGGTDPALDVGDVVIPEQWAFHDEAAYLNEDPDKPGAYLVPDYLNPKIENFDMIFPDSIRATRGDGLGAREMPFFPCDPELLDVARRVVPTLPPMTKGGRTVDISVGGNGVAGTVFLDNARYREWIFKIWQARCLDMESTALAQVAWANEIPILIVRGLSDLAGGQHGKNPIDDNELRVSEIAAKATRAIIAAHAK